MNRLALLVLLAGCGQEPPRPPAPPVFPPSALPEPRPLDVLSASFPDLGREVPDLDLPSLPPPRPFPPDPAWDRHHGYRIAHPVVIETLPPSSWFVRNHPSVLDALARLALLQEEDGSWGPRPACAECGPGADMDRVTTTAHALLAFIRAGISNREIHLHDRVRLDEALRRGLRWMIADQEAAGGVDRRSLRQQAVASALFEEAGGGSLLLREAAARSRALLLNAPLGGADAESIAWAAIALSHGYPISPAHAEWSVRARSALDALPPAKNGPAAAWAALARMRLDRHKGDSRISRAMDELLRNKPSPQLEDPGYEYAGTWALLQYDGPSGPKWKAWSEALLPRLEGRLRSAACPQAAAWLAQTFQSFHPAVWRTRYGHRSS